VERVGAGLLVDPKSPRAIAEAINWILTHPEEADQMGQRGRQAVQSTYNWSTEAAKLIRKYEEVLGAD
jgi:glycosyltransferase involved in cell wall biosynthesis